MVKAIRYWHEVMLYDRNTTLTRNVVLQRASVRWRTTSHFILRKNALTLYRLLSEKHRHCLLARFTIRTLHRAAYRTRMCNIVKGRYLRGCLKFGWRQWRTMKMRRLHQR